jgi:lysophospholipase L1-like esterase
MGCASGRPEAGKIPVPEVSSNDPAIVPVSCLMGWWVTRHDEKINNVVYDQKIIFIGDSITQGFEDVEAWKALNTKYSRKITNLGFSGDGTEHVIWRIENGEYPAGINPEYVVLLIGTNNSYEPASTAAGIGKIIRLINNNSPKAKILLFALLPRGSGINDADTVRNYKVNDIIKNYDGYLNVTYIDMGNNFMEDTGELRKKLFRDRLHLTREGYAVWKDIIINAVDKQK